MITDNGDTTNSGTNTVGSNSGQGNLIGVGNDNLLSDSLASLIVNGTQGQTPVNLFKQPDWNTLDPVQIFKHTNGVGNCIIPRHFGSMTINFPGWMYNNQDNESGTGMSGVGVMTFESYGGKTKGHILYRDLGSGSYFYVTRHGHSDKGYEPQSRQKYPWDVPGPRLLEDATVGADDDFEKTSDPARYNAAIIEVPDPHLSKEDFMNIVYPNYDNPSGKPLFVNSNPSTFLNETIDDTKYTPQEDFNAQVSAAKLPSAMSSNITSAYSQRQDLLKKSIGRDTEPIDPNFHVFRPVNMEAIRTHPDMAAADIIGLSGGKYGQEQAWQLIKAYVNTASNRTSCGQNGTGLPDSIYYQILKYNNPRQINKYVALSLATGKSSFASTPLTKLQSLAPYQTNLAGYMYKRQYYYENLLFDYFADDSKFFSGSITVTGRIGVEYGKRLILMDQRHRYVWEFYIDGVDQDFMYNAQAPDPWTTTIYVERGLPFTFEEAEEDYRDPNDDATYVRDTNGTDFNGRVKNNVGSPILGNFSKRFTAGFWGRGEPFTGGVFGEQTLPSMISQASERDKAYMSRFGGGSTGSSSSKAKSSGGSTSKLFSAAVALMKEYHGGKYVGEQSSDPGRTDCSGFCWCAMKKAGYSVPSTPATFVTDDLRAYCEKQKYLKKVPASETKSGSMVVSGGEGMDGHMGILGEHWHGTSTKVIDDNAGENIKVEPYKQGFGGEKVDYFCEPAS